MFLPNAFVWADIQSPNASLNYAQKSLSNAGNPAAAALTVERKDPTVMTGAIIEVGAGLEYGNFDELFATYNKLSNAFKPPEDDTGDGNPSLPPQPENPIKDFEWQDLLDKYPDLEDKVDVLKEQVVGAAGLLAVIASEGYAKAEVNSNMSFVLNEDLYGGTLLLGFDIQANANVIGLFEDVSFDKEQAKSALQTIPDFTENDPVQALDLSAGIVLFYNPANNKVKLTIDNDSILLVKSAKIGKFSLAYSKKAHQTEQGALYWGVKPAFYRVGLTSVTARIGDITDSESIFEDIKNAEYTYKNGFDFDAGLVWAASNYQVGASVVNVIEQTYEYPELDRSDLTSSNILRRLTQHQEYTMERQVKLEAGVFTDQRSWSLHAELDANAIEDPMRDEYQWFTLTAGYASDSWWLPSARIGMSRNLAGTQMGYLNAGVTIMKFFNLDVASALDSVTIDDQKVMRGINVRFGVQFDF